MIFVLSAVHPDKFITVLRNLASKMKSNGKILFRDYAINDHAMIRFKSGSKVMSRSRLDDRKEFNEFCHLDSRTHVRQTRWNKNILFHY